jgi:hypothetical protein
MDSAHGFDDEDRIEIEDDAGCIADAGVDDNLFDLGGDERRMHVRAYNHWVSLLKGRPYPSIEDLDPASIADFGANSVLLDFSAGIEDPAIAFLGRELREECALDVAIKRIVDVPSRSLLSRLTDHYLQIIANRAPIGFEAEFVGTRGRITMYRGILMPFSSNGEIIDFIYGVINWKEVVDNATQATLDAELDAAVRAGPKACSDAPIWADGPSALVETAEDEEEEYDDADLLDLTGELLLSGTLADRLAQARESAALVRAADTRSRAALYRTLARAHDFALASEEDPASYAELLEDAGLAVQARAPMTPVVKLVFGGDYDKTRLAEYAAVLHHARRHGVGPGGLATFLDSAEGGIKAIVAAERAAKRPTTPSKAATAKAALFDQVRAELLARPSLAAVPIGAEAAEFVVLLARANAQGTLDVVARVDGAGTVDAVIRAAA